MAAVLAAALISASVASPRAEDTARSAGLAGDYFVGPSVFLFQRTVLSAFAPPEDLKDHDTEIQLDAGAIALAREHAEDESGAVALEAMRGWLRAWLSGKPEPEALPGFTAARRKSLACLMYGADPDGHVDFAQLAKLDGDERKNCIARYADAAGRWQGWLEPFRRAPGAPVPLSAAPEGAPSEGEPVLRLAFAPAVDAEDEAIAEAMRKNGLFQLLTDNLNATLAMPRPITALLTQCGEAKAFYNADRGEAVLCYELLAGLLRSAP